MSAVQLELGVEDVPDRLMREAEEWRRDNPRAFGAIVAWAYEDAPSGRCAMQQYLEALRRPEYAQRLYVHRADAVYLCNHNLRSALTRLVLREHPSLPFHIRRSSCDPQRGTYATPVVAR